VAWICQYKVCISYRKSVANLSAQGLYQLQEKYCESVSSRYGFTDTESGVNLSVRGSVCISCRKSVPNLSAQGMVLDTGSGMNLSVQGMYKLQEKCCESVSSRYGFGYREWHESVSTRYVMCYWKSVANLSAQGMVLDTGSDMNLSVKVMYQLQKKCCESVSARYG
jgi:hypothetical protein